MALTDRTDQAPAVQYIAEIQTVDYAIDLAVIKVTETIDGDLVTETFPFVELGDSDAVDIGDAIKILGYPGIGGETITFTSARSSARRPTNRRRPALNQTDATSPAAQRRPA